MCSGSGIIPCLNKNTLTSILPLSESIIFKSKNFHVYIINFRSLLIVSSFSLHLSHQLGTALSQSVLSQDVRYTLSWCFFFLGSGTTKAGIINNSIGRSINSIINIDKINQTSTFHNAKLILKYSTAYPFKNTFNNFCCSLCDEHFPEPNSWREHMQNDHNTFNFFNVFYKQKYVRLDITDLKCRICSQNVDSIDTFLSHLNEIHHKPVRFNEPHDILCYRLDPTNWQCVYCTESFILFKHLTKHTEKHFHDHICDTCGESFLLVSHLKKHIHTVHQITFPCKSCDNIFNTYDEYRSHIKKKHKAVSKCFICKDKPCFSTWYARESHLIEVHGKNKTLHVCHFCNKEFSVRSKMHIHIMKEHRVAKHKCNSCDGRFKTKGQLMNHLPKHTDERPFKCTVCSKDFKRKKSLTVHMNIHCNDKKYVCQECGVAFVQNYSLKLHFKNHHKKILSV